MIVSTSETDAVVSSSVDFLIVCPDNLVGSPEITSTTATFLLINLASDGLIKNCSKSTTVGVSPNKTLNKILKDSAVPFDS